MYCISIIYRVHQYQKGKSKTVLFQNLITPIYLQHFLVPLLFLLRRHLFIAASCWLFFRVMNELHYRFLYKDHSNSTVRYTVITGHIGKRLIWYNVVQKLDEQNVIVRLVRLSSCGNIVIMRMWTRMFMFELRLWKLHLQTYIIMIVNSRILLKKSHVQSKVPFCIKAFK